MAQKWRSLMLLVEVAGARNLFSLADQPGFFWGLAPTKNKIEFDRFAAYHHLYSSNEAFGKPEYCPVR
jgi:hypothetical protein